MNTQTDKSENQKEMSDFNRLSKYSLSGPKSEDKMVFL